MAAPTVLKTLQPNVTVYSHTQRRTIRLPRILNELLGRNEKKAEAEEDKRSREEVKRQATLNIQKRLTTTRLESDSIFEDEISGKYAAKELVPVREQQTQTPERDVTPSGKSSLGLSYLKAHIQPNADPDPRGRQIWLRKRVTADVERNLDPKGRETKAERILRTEKTLTSHSQKIATSTKKLVHLARQVAGKTVDDAIVQMQFSKKKYAHEVKFELLRARDAATLSRGMGLGAVGGVLASDSPQPPTPTRIKLKDGKSLTVTDPTKMYVAEAWVDKGRRRGSKRIYSARANSSRKVFKTSFIVLRLKEQKTLIREAEDRKAKAYARGPWIHLPNRPVTAQRQHYSW